MVKVGILSNTKITANLIEGMLLGFGEIVKFSNREELYQYLLSDSLNLLLIDRVVDNFTSKEIISKIDKLPPTILIISDDYNKDIDGDNYSFVLKRPFSQEEMRDIISFLVFKEYPDDPQNINILIVDDSKILRDILKSKIEFLGYNYLEASNGEEALNLLTKNPLTPSLIITDQEMPGISGIQLSKRIRDLDKSKNIPILMITSLYDDMKLRNEAFSAGINQIIPKPFEDSLIESSIKQFFSRNGQTDQSSKIALLDDSNSRRKAMESIIRGHGYHILSTTSTDKFIQFVKNNPFDLLIIDFILENTTGIELIQELRNNLSISAPILIYTAFDNINMRKKLSEIFNAGGNDYLLAPFEIEELIFKVKTWLNYFKLLKEHKSRESQLQKILTYDMLTNVYNRFNILKRGEEYFALSKRKGYPLSLLYMDIDHFKRVNDTYGHNFGDIVLKKFSSVVNTGIRKEDVFGRVGGEEFIAILPYTSEKEASIVAEKIRDMVSKITFEEHNEIKDLKITTSIGVSVFSNQKNFSTFDDIISKADKALYKAKTAGRNKVVFY